MHGLLILTPGIQQTESEPKLFLSAAQLQAAQLFGHRGLDMNRAFLGATLLLASHVAIADEHEMDSPGIVELCQGGSVAACAVIGVTIPWIAAAVTTYALGEALTVACGEPLEPGAWGPDTTGVKPFYVGQWQYVDCPPLPVGRHLPRGRARARAARGSARHSVHMAIPSETTIRELKLCGELCHARLARATESVLACLHGIDRPMPSERS